MHDDDRDRYRSAAASDFLLPATDRGVYAQAIGALVIYGVALWFVRAIDRNARNMVSCTRSSASGGFLVIDRATRYRTSTSGST